MRSLPTLSFSLLSLSTISLLVAGWMIALVAVIQPAQAFPTEKATPISPAGKDATSPAIAITRQGSVHIAWEQDGGIWYRHWRNGSWSNALEITSDGESPVMAADPYGEVVYIAWVQEFGGNFEIFARKWDSVQGWTAPQNVSSNDGGSASPALTTSPDGKIYLLWADTTPGTSTIYYAISPDGESWPLALPVPDAQGGSPAVAFDATGRLHLAWQYRASFTDNLRIWTARYENNTWSTPKPLTDGTSQAFGVDMAGQGGRVALVWQEANQVKLAVLQQNHWIVNASRNGSAPAVTITRDGVIEWAWETASGLSRQFGIGGWTTPLSWSIPDSGAIDLDASHERVGLVWVEKQNSSQRVFFNQEQLVTMYQPLTMTR